MNLGKTRLRGRPRNRWQDEVREDGWIVGGEGWQEKVHNGEEWKKLLKTARNRRFLHMPKEWMNEWINIILSQKIRTRKNKTVKACDPLLFQEFHFWGYVDIVIFAQAAVKFMYSKPHVLYVVLKHLWLLSTLTLLMQCFLSTE